MMANRTILGPQCGESCYLSWRPEGLRFCSAFIECLACCKIIPGWIEQLVRSSLSLETKNVIFFLPNKHCDSQTLPNTKHDGSITINRLDGRIINNRKKWYG